MADLKDQIEDLFARRGELDPRDGEARAVVDAAIDLLDKGEVRVAEYGPDGEVIVHQWLKQAILLLGLLPNPDAYWRDYVFNTFAKMPDSEAVRDWILKCLNGDNAVYFRKSVDVLRMWGMFGNPRLNDENLLRPLNWAEKEMHSVAFREALKKVSNILS